MLDVSFLLTSNIQHLYREFVAQSIQGVLFYER
jgi:hypothetical protein